MGELIDLAERRAHRQPGGDPTDFLRRGPAPTFYFDLASPFTYLAAERVERLLGSVQWRPASAEALHRGAPTAGESLRETAERRAAALGMPIVWPERFPAPASAAMRAAAYAAEQGRGAPFTLAAARLAYCGGFDLTDPEVLAEAAAVAGVGLEECLQAAGDVARDGPLEATARRLLSAGADRLPAFAAANALVCGEERLAEVAAWARSVAPSASERRRDRRVTRR
jgi:2-hydroxychromene-2-carboxylate isomerase